MKKILLVLLILWVNLGYAQKTNLLCDEAKIKKILSDNIATRWLPDSLAIYTFYIKVTPQRKRVNTVYVSDTVGHFFFNNLDSLLSDVDFKKFLKGSRQNHVIIPVGVVLTAYNGMKADTRFKLYDLNIAIPKLMAANDLTRFESVFLEPLFVMVDKWIYD